VPAVDCVCPQRHQDQINLRVFAARTTKPSRHQLYLVLATNRETEDGKMPSRSTPE